jgi:hypothetical protein
MNKTHVKGTKTCVEDVCWSHLLLAGENSVNYSKKYNFDKNFVKYG